MLDLTKAFDSVDRDMAWQILQSRGVPDKLVTLIKDLHTNHTAIIRTELDSQPVPTNVGFKQGCNLALDLFTITLDTIVRHLLPQLRQLGVTISYKLDGHIMHSRNPTETELMWILLYADDISLICDDIVNFSTAVSIMDSTFTQWGLTINTNKTKVLVVGHDAETQAANTDIYIRGHKLEVVSSFTYLGCIFASDATIDAEVTHQVAAAIVAVVRLRKAKVWSTRALSRFTKLQFFQSIVMSVLLYGAETWTLLNKHCAALSVFLMNCLRHICGKSLQDRIANETILSQCETCAMHSQLRSKRLRWYGHVCRILDTRLPKVMFGQVKGSTPPGRPRKIWNDIVLSDFQLLNITRPYRDAQNKPAWRERTWATHT